MTSKCCYKILETSTSLPQNKQCRHRCIQEFRELGILEENCRFSSRNEQMKHFVNSRYEDNLCSRQALTLRKHEALNRLEEVCGQPLTLQENDEMWQCLMLSKYISEIEEKHLSNGETVSNVLKPPKGAVTGRMKEKKNQKTYDFGMNPAKRYCCDRVEGEMCRQLCYKTYSNNWLEASTAYRKFCQHIWSHSLHECLRDTEGVCRYGCESKMKFCSHYNNQFRLFRHCNSKSDIEASKTYARWLENNMIQDLIFPGTQLHFEDMSKCRSDAWRRFACHLHTQPCVSASHSSNICRQSCVELITECLDKKRNQTIEPEIICKVLAGTMGQQIKSQEENKDCIDFLGGNRVTLHRKQTQQSRKSENSFYSKSKNEKHEYSNWAMEATPSVWVSNQNVCYESNCFQQNRSICYRSRISNECFSRSSWNYSIQKRCRPTCALGKLNEWQIGAGDSVSVPVTTSLNWGAEENSLNENQYLSRAPDASENEFPGKSDRKDGGQMFEKIKVKNECSNICMCNRVRARDRSENGQPLYINEKWPKNDRVLPESVTFDMQDTHLECDLYCLSANFSNFAELFLQNLQSEKLFPDSRFPVMNDFRAPHVQSNLPLCSSILLQKEDDYQRIRFCRAPSINFSHEYPNFLKKFQRVINPDYGIRLLCFGVDLSCCIEAGLPEATLFPVFSSEHTVLIQIIYARDLQNSDNVACDNRGNEQRFDTIVARQSSISLAYPGPCLDCCSLYGPICGRDGRNYSSDCVARSYRVGVDYWEPCKSSEWECSQISPGCPFALQNSIPGTKCPFCGSVAYFIILPFLSSLVPAEDKHYFTQKYAEKLTVSSIVEQFHQLSSVNCEIFAHKPIENILAVSFVPEYSSSPLVYQTRARSCELEMKRIVTLFKKKSPRIKLWFPLMMLEYNSKIRETLEQILTKTESSSVSILLLSQFNFLPFISIILLFVFKFFM